MQGIGISAVDETTWVDQARLGSPEAFTCLVEAYQRPVYNLCYRMLGEPEAAEDAAQETFLKAHQHLAGYDPQRSFATWLLAIAAHYCIDRLRRRHFLPISFLGDEEYEPRLPDHKAPDPETETDRRLDCERLHRLLQSLHPLQRVTLVMHYWQGASETEIAQALHLSVAAVKSRLHRARQALADRWYAQPEHFPYPGEACEKAVF
jgi:RNA polymerase sigma-70 factor (ECF subfamily)